MKIIQIATAHYDQLNNWAERTEQVHCLYCLFEDGSIGVTDDLGKTWSHVKLPGMSPLEAHPVEGD